jgi:ferredoxin-thioredoxin reductase catalytic subunit
MKMQIKVNPDTQKAKEIREKVKENDGYCPCSLFKNEDTKCPCKEFLNSQELGECHCGLYIKVEV